MKQQEFAILEHYTQYHILYYACNKHILHTFLLQHTLYILSAHAFEVTTGISCALELL